MRVKKLTFLRILNSKTYIQGRGFRGGLDEKMRRMRLGVDIIVADLPPLILQYDINNSKKILNFSSFNRHFDFI